MPLLPLLFVLGGAVAWLGYTSSKKTAEPLAVAKRLPMNLRSIPAWADASTPIEVDWPGRPSLEGVTLVTWAYAEIVQAIRQGDQKIVLDLVQILRSQARSLEADFLIAAANYVGII